MGLEDITGLRLSFDADNGSTCETEIELLTPSASCDVHRFRFASVEERRHWADKLTELIFSRECRALGSTSVCPHCTSAKRAPGDVNWSPHVGSECLWQPVSSKKNSHHQQVLEPFLAKVVYRGWPEFAKPCKEKGHRQQWLGLVLTRSISKGGDGTVKGVQYFVAAPGCGRMIATANARCTPVPLGWVAPEITPEPEPEPESAQVQDLEQTLDTEQGAKGMRPAEGTPPNPSRPTRRPKKTAERRVTGGGGGVASRLDKLAEPKNTYRGGQQRAPDREVHKGKTGARASARTRGEAQARARSRPQRVGARDRGRGRGRGRSRGRGRGQSQGPD